MSHFPLMSSLVSPRERPMIPLFLTAFIDLLGLGIAIPVLAIVFFDTNLSILPADTPLATRSLLYGLLVGSYPLAQFFGAPILGALSDRYGRKPTLLVPLLGTSIGYVLFAIGLQTHDLPLLFFSRILDGFAGGSLSIVLSSVADISRNPAVKTRNFGIIGMAFGLGFILGPYIGGKLSDPAVLPWFTFSTPFLAAGALAAINMLLCMAVFRETLTKRIQSPISPLTGLRNLRKAFTLGHVRTMFIVVFLMALGFNFFTQFFQLFLIERFAFTQVDIGELFAYAGLWIAITQGLLTPAMARRFSPNSIFLWSSLLLGLSFPLLLLPTSTYQLYIIIPILAIFQGLSQPPANTIISDLSARDSQGEIMGINQSVQAMAMALPPILGGMIVSVHFTLPIFAASLLTVVAWLIFVVFFRHKPQQELFHEE